MKLVRLIEITVTDSTDSAMELSTSTR